MHTFLGLPPLPRSSLGVEGGSLIWADFGSLEFLVLESFAGLCVVGVGVGCEGRPSFFLPEKVVVEGGACVGSFFVSASDGGAGLGGGIAAEQGNDKSAVDKG